MSFPTPTPPKKKPIQRNPLAFKAMRGAFRFLGPKAPELMGRLAYHLWFTPRKIKRPLWEHQIASRADETFTVNAANRTVAVWAWGRGPTVLLVHGWEGRGTQLGRFIEPLLSQGFRVVCFDAPAHGDSKGKQTNAVEQRALIEAISAREGGLHAVITHSFGAVPTSLAMRWGLPLTRAVFISPPSELKTMLGYFQRFLQIPDEVMVRMRARIERQFPELGARLWHDLCTHENVSHFPNPGMVIHDRTDDVVPIGQGRLVAGSWRCVDHYETDGLGHRRILKDPGVIERVVHFLSGGMRPADA